MATHSSILAWRTPWTEESGGCSSCGQTEAESDLTEGTWHSTHAHHDATTAALVNQFEPPFPCLLNVCY